MCNVHSQQKSTMCTHYQSFKPRFFDNNMTSSDTKFKPNKSDFLLGDNGSISGGRIHLTDFKTDWKSKNGMDNVTSAIRHLSVIGQGYESSWAPTLKTPVSESLLGVSESNNGLVSFNSVIQSKHLIKLHGNARSSSKKYKSKSCHKQTKEESSDPQL